MEKVERERYNVYIKKEAMIALRKYCLDTSKKVSNVLEEMILRQVTEHRNKGN